MNSAILTNILPVAVAGNSSGAKEAGANQSAQTLLDSGNMTSKTFASDKILAKYQQKGSNNKKQKFEEKLQQIMTACQTGDIDTDFKAKLFGGKQKDESQLSAIPVTNSSLTNLKSGKELISANIKINTEKSDSSNTNTIVTQSNHGLLSSVINKPTAPTDRHLGQEPTLTKAEISGLPEQSDTRKRVQIFFDNGTHIVRQNLSEPQGKTPVKISKPETETLANPEKTDAAKLANLVSSDTKPEKLNVFEKIVAVKESISGKPPETEQKGQNGLSGQNLPQKQNAAKTPDNDDNATISQLLKDPAAVKTKSESTTLKTEGFQNIFTNNNAKNDQTVLADDFRADNVGTKGLSPMATDMKTALGESSKAIHQQITESITSAVNSDSKQITIRLSPPELGKVVIRVSQQDSKIDTIVVADKAETRNQLQHAIGQVTKNLADSGITMRQCEVRLADQGKGSFESSFSQFSQSDTGSRGRGFDEQATENIYHNNYETDNISNLSSEPSSSQNYITEKSVNLLI